MMSGWKWSTVPWSAVLVAIVSSLTLGHAFVSLSSRVHLTSELYEAESRLMQKFMGIKYASRSGGLLSPSIEDAVYPEDNRELEIIESEKNPRYICPQCDTETVPEFIRNSIPLAFEHGGAQENFEECLSLNVYRSNDISNEDKKRVVVLVHGGGLNSGSSYQGHYNPEYFFRDENNIGHDTILVSINYSLGPFGFWANTDKSGTVQGNAALFELFSALRWVHNNISKFGGDPSDITVMGHSAGAALVHWAHLALHSEELVKKAGLWFADGRSPFRKMLLMGGSAFLFRVLDFEEAQEQQNLLLKKLYIDDEKSLKTISNSAIADAAKGLFWSFVKDDVWIKGDAAFHLQNELFGSTWKLDVRATYNSHDSSMFCLSKEEIIRQQGLNFWNSFLSEKNVKEIEKYYDCDKFKGCKLRAGICLSTDAIFVEPTRAIKTAYEKKDLPVDIHEFSFDLKFENIHEIVKVIDLGKQILPKIGEGCSKISSFFDQLSAISRKSNGPGGVSNFLGKAGQFFDGVGKIAGRGEEKIDSFKALGTIHIAEIWMSLGSPMRLVEGKIKRGHMLVEHNDRLVNLKPLLTFIKEGSSPSSILCSKPPREIYEGFKRFPVGEVVQSIYMNYDRNKQTELYIKHRNRQTLTLKQIKPINNSESTRKRQLNDFQEKSNESNKSRKLVDQEEEEEKEKEEEEEEENKGQVNLNDFDGDSESFLQEN